MAGVSDWPKASPVKVTYYDSKTDTEPTLADVSWEDLSFALSDAEEAPCGPTDCAGAACPHKDGPCWSPVELAPGTGRANKNVRAVTVAVLDLDHLSDEQVGGVARALEPYRYVCHSTHCHAPPADNRLRIVLPLSRPVKPSEWKTFHPALVSFLGVPADPACKDVSRFYFLPRTRQGIPLLFETNEGHAVDVDAVLRTANGATVKAPPPMVDSQGAIDLELVREAIRSAIRSKERSHGEKKERDRETAATLRALLEEKKFAEPGGRDMALNRAMTALAFAFAPGTPFTALAHVLRPSLAATSTPDDAADPVAYWLAEAEDQYKRAQVRRAELEEESAAARRASIQAWTDYLGGRKKKKQSSNSKTAATASALTDEETTTETETTEDDEGDWRDLLQRDKSGYASSGYNARVILSHAEEAGTIRWNQVTKQIDVFGGLFEDEDPETLPVNVTDWLYKAWGISLQTSVVTDRLIAVARENAYNPIQDFLTSLAWDGTPRLDTWLTTYLSAETVNDATGEDISKWVTRLGRMWLISMIARGLDPGCQVDTMPILEGRQGVGKTTTLRILGGRWHTDTKITLGDKDSYMVAAANWVVELAEVAALKRGDLETVKAYLTAREDSFRVPYGRAIGKYARVAIFVGTTNETEGYLIDPTGNRRYWPIRVGVIDVPGLAAVRDQLLAEAVVAYRSGEKWHFSLEDAAAFELAVTASRGPGADSYELFIKQWWPRSGNKVGYVTTAEVAVQCLQLPKERVTRHEQMRVGAALKALGWKRKRVRVDGSPEWVYCAPEAAQEVKVTDPNIVSIAEARAKKGEAK